MASCSLDWGTGRGLLLRGTNPVPSPGRLHPDRRPETTLPWLGCGLQETDPKKRGAHLRMLQEDSPATMLGETRRVEAAIVFNANDLTWTGSEKAALLPIEDVIQQTASDPALRPTVSCYARNAKACSAPHVHAHTERTKCSAAKIFTD